MEETLQRICPKCNGSGKVEKKQNRSIPQNRYYHGVVIPIIADEIGESKETVHDVLKYKFNSIGVNLSNDESLTVGGSTTKLNTKQFEMYLESIREWSNIFLGIRIPLPNEVTDEMLIEMHEKYRYLD